MKRIPITRMRYANAPRRNKKMLLSVRQKILVEFVPDEIIGDIFQTTLHTTQAIVFYILFCLFLYALYKMGRWLKWIYGKRDATLLHSLEKNSKQIKTLSKYLGREP
jgi:hypothetical protein